MMNIVEFGRKIAEDLNPANGIGKILQAFQHKVEWELAQETASVAIARMMTIPGYESRIGPLQAALLVIQKDS